LSLLSILSTTSFAQNVTYNININQSDSNPTDVKVKKTANTKSLATQNKTVTKTETPVFKSQKPVSLYSKEKEEIVKQYNRRNTVKRFNSLNSTIENLAQGLIDSSRVKQSYLEDIAITTFVDLHKFNQTSHFGRNISESFFDELFTRGFNVSEFRGQDNLSINKSGEYLLTRDSKLLNKIVKNKYILVGTYSKFEDSILISARIINNENGRMVASARSYYNTDDCKLLESCPKKRRINIRAHNNYLVKNTTNNVRNIIKISKL
jgi:TolB-like protein